ncbi:hypothetical protein MMC07_003727 [Pseudocyphellaria aurata]|nr:hypothetical protein [Pseudocyphellaria aurata]
MAALHAALQTLSPTSFSSVPTSEAQAKEYLQDAFSKAQLIIDSVPPPPVEDSLAAARSRSASNLSASSEVSTSTVRSDPLNLSHALFQKEWGKPIKLAAKDNPFGIGVYKMAGKDGRGAWFARRSVHEGMGFKKWKIGLENEFPESMAVQGGPGEGNIRGIGGERRVEKMAVKGVGSVEVYHLSAQFPGPTTPRDFVTLLITSSSALGNFSSSQSSSAADGQKSKSSQMGLGTRHFMVISKPCIHSDCPPRDGFIRGQYESVEFIREIPLKRTHSSSVTDLHKTERGRASSSSPDRKARLRMANDEAIQNENADSQSSHKQANPRSPRTSLDANSAARGRLRGRTISYAESRGLSAKGELVDACRDESEELAEANPVEWIMVTRSDPGGSVPRFLVERGTPAGIVADASKFIDWAFKKEHIDTDGMQQNDKSIGVDGEAQNAKDAELDASSTNGHLAGLKDILEQPETLLQLEEPDHAITSNSLDHNQQEGLLAGMANAAYNGIETYAPQVVINHLPGYQEATSVSASAVPKSEVGISNGTQGIRDDDVVPSIPSSSSVASFASAEDHFEQEFSKESSSSLPLASQAKDSVEVSPQEKELAKLNERKKLLDEKLAKTREKELKDKEDLTSREEERLRKAEEKHAREIQRQEEKYKKEVAKLQAKRLKEAAKEEERRRKAEDKDEKTRLTRENEGLKQQLDVVRQERDILKDQVGALQKENTALVAGIGKTGEGSSLLRELRGETSGTSRSRSGSLRRVLATSVVLDGSAPVAEKLE